MALKPPLDRPKNGLLTPCIGPESASNHLDKPQMGLQASSIGLKMASEPAG